MGDGFRMTVSRKREAAMENGRRETVDPVTFEVIWHRLHDITEEMGIKYMRTSGSPILVGAYDASTGITLPDGELVAMGPYITTQAHVLRLIIGSVIDKRATAPGIHAGDMYICNDPYLGATHQPDVATVAPVFHDGELRAWVGSSGHWLDIGGPEPGGFNMNAITVFDEGLRMIFCTALEAQAAAGAPFSLRRRGRPPAKCRRHGH